MALLFWHKDYEVGISKVDSQHKHLIDLINRLHAAMLQGNNKEEVSAVIDNLQKYSQYHFNTEEELFDKHNYSASEKHKSSHAYFICRIQQFKEDFDSLRGGLTMEMLQFLRDWWISHIMMEDKEFGPFLVEKGCS